MLAGNNMLMSSMFGIAVAYKLREARIQAVLYMHAGLKMHACCTIDALNVYSSDVRVA